MIVITCTTLKLGSLTHEHLHPCTHLDKETKAADASLLTKVLRTKLVENVHDVEVQMKDPNSPLYSAKSFEELRLYVLQPVMFAVMEIKIVQQISVQIYQSSFFTLSSSSAPSFSPSPYSSPFPPPPPTPPTPLPLHSRPALLKGVYAMGFNRPSKIQERALPLLLADPPENFIAQSQSGTGKTAAFVLAMLSRVDTTKSYPQVRVKA